MLKKNIRPWLLAIGAVPLALTLTGCFGIPGLPNAPSGPDGGNDGGTDQVDDEMVEDIVEGGDSDVDFESGSLPADFPVGDIPLVEGEVGPSMSISDGAAWTVTIFTADEATAKSAPELLEEAGFVNEAVFWENEEYLVFIMSTDEGDDGRWYVYYQIQRQQ